jgi:hypothetical protein
LFVLVGPFNEHLLAPKSLECYEQVQAATASWLTEKKVPHAVRALMPSEQYGEASHPLAERHKQLARQRAEDPFFR